MAEDLVPPTRDRLVHGSGHAEQDVDDAVPAGLARPGEVEPARAVVQQCGVGRAQRERDRRVALVTGGADRVVAELLPLEPTGGVVAVTAVDLGAP